MHKSRNISAKNREDIIVAILIERKLGEDLIFLEHYYNRNILPGSKSMGVNYFALDYKIS